MNRLSTSKLRPELAPVPVPVMWAIPVKPLKSVIVLGSPVPGRNTWNTSVPGPNELDPARDMPQLPGLPRRQRRARAEHLPAEEPGGAQPRPGGQELAAARRMPVARLKRANGDR